MIKKEPNIKNCYFKGTLRPAFISIFLLLLSLNVFSADLHPNIFLTVPISFVSPSKFASYLIPTALVCTFVIVILLYRKLNVSKGEYYQKTQIVNKLEAEITGLNTELTHIKELFKKQKYESDKFYKSLFLSASDGISFYDKDYNLQFANPSFYTLLGADREDTYEGMYSDRIHPDDKEKYIERSAQIKNTGFYEGEFRLRHSNGHYLNLSCRTVAVNDDNNEFIGALSILRDNSKQNLINEELTKAKFDAESSNRLKSSFLANISHEIRTPLNSVVGFSNLLLADDISKEIREEYVEHINHNSEKLLQIIGDIIDLSRLESSQIEITYEEASLISIVNEIIEDARLVIKRNDKPIILNVKNEFVDNSDLIFTDRIWLKRVLNHLMDNAVKFTLDGSIELLYSLEGDNIVFKIKDTGIGIKEENLKRIFEEFRQEVDGHQRPFEGLGIGLTLAKEVVERMGGKIDVKSEKGIGSEFSFSLPYRPAGSIKVKLSEKNIGQLPGTIDWSLKKCLLVDDNKDVLIYLSRILVDTGVKILVARSGFEAIEMIKSNPDIDVVLLDMQMPEMNGIEATREIRKIRKTIPIIAQTAFVFEDEKDIIIEAGCDACLIKPIRKEHLLTVMSSFVNSN